MSPDLPSKQDQGWNLVWPTMGGKQFWTDQFIHGDWRIQKHAYTGHYRLLDPRNFRCTSGSYDKCRERFEELKIEKSIPPLVGKAAILLHGLGRARSSMSRIAQDLQNHGFLPINVEYASTRAPIREHAAALHRIITGLEGVEEIYFAGHSMGNIVWRYYLREYTDSSLQFQGDSRIKATVMIAPPNHGAHIARMLKPTGLFGLLTGKSGKSLASSDWNKFAESLAIPQHRFAIIAGKFNGNPMFRVDNDTIVSIDETKLPGADDFLVVKSMHVAIMSHPQVVQAVARFFRNGHLVSNDQVSPLPATQSEN